MPVGVIIRYNGEFSRMTFAVSLFSSSSLHFAVALQIFSELTEKEATVGAVALFTIQAEAVMKKEGYVACFSVGDASVSLSSFA